MPRPTLLFTGPWADRPLEELVGSLAEWGYTGVELCCWGDHLEIQRALSESDYCQNKLDLLARHELTLNLISNHRVGQAIGDAVIDARHQALVPDYVWGNGEPLGVRQRAIEEMIATIRVAERLGVGLVAGFIGSPLASYVGGWPPPSRDTVESAFEQFAELWYPILDVCRETGIKFALEVHPGQLAYDLYTAQRLLEAVDHHSEFGFLLDPAHLHWQGIDPVAFIRQFPERIWHVHIKDAMLTLDGKSGLLGSFWPQGDARRGWQYRSPGHGGIDWQGFIRALHQIDYAGALAVDWSDPEMDRDFGAADACQFVKRLDFPTKPRPEPGAFRPV
ncbi:sugar phosphate isomerase/epimerase family protein [Tuwongella immobilis]|uniref:Xylose isomerase-like TIM barrel domain-containing protein n=1 Tax=Tuwongella immobilis TaxID=692036 RepID=A0A6C2YUJ4_9BACT|nr:sugar phosphate isomerase/epimerase [Tuwongella immobilis]VIP04823.1 Xylose isomerase domain-containing protein OS=Rhodopirellula europaea SH398 GN=RESH_04061 PE=4 SV=1: AP_endonuc_2: AP_endonuc_2_N [Tuwongella immobilis]VTS07006.1 Xylose isomerase domain-containing protein OS=Rhodopirellula europaea SH398 GN=RESH_04061 PE=4 SV=1: AP_endonuc_2: AP_endonuc_2_N [Tuwongella immobilis]